MREKLLRFLLIALFVASFARTSLVFAQSDRELTVGEQWVLQQTTAGNIADLAIQFPEEEDRILGGDFLLKLLGDPSIPITRFGIRIKNAVFHEPVNLEHMEVNHVLWLENCRFKSTTNLHGTHFRKEISFANSTFESWVFMAQVVTDEELNLADATFEDQANLSYAQINSYLNLANTRFTHSEQKVNLSQAVIKSSIFLQGAKFAGPADFRYLTIGNNLEANDVEFQSTSGTVYFGQMNVGYSVFLKQAKFAGPVDFEYVTIGNNLEADGVEFSNATNTADFHAMNVSYAILLSEASFAGPVDFSYVEVGNSLVANDTQFMNMTEISYFRQMTVGYSIFLERTEIAGPVDFSYTKVGGDFSAIGTQFKYAHEGAVNLSSMKVENNIRLTTTRFSGAVDLQNSECRSLIVQDVIWPAAHKIDIRGLTYQAIEAWKWEKDEGQIRDDWAKLIWFVDQAPFSAQTYKTLETSFYNQGYPERADEVFIHYKLRERDQLTSTLEQAWNFFLNYFILYGRLPARAFVWSFLIVAIGCVFFWKQDWMVPNSREKDSSPGETPLRYYPILYSLDLFLGPVDLAIADQWQPKPERVVAFYYSKFMLLAGWILIPIGLLAITGLIK